ncbi:DNA alkylation repair protein [Actinomadura fibrosa]|uniref:DNA alkylation repair protein n=1 Tax=Actinomadura fibrosa TaxID=111802 RepID=A0ABW2XJD9_9ACTN|nr:DNA alkylation repair protein [Actinomadura fibrosa]
MDVEGGAARIVAGLRAQADPARAEKERAYLKSDFAHIGVPVPALRTVALPVVREVRTRDEALALAEALWTVTDGGRPVHETRMAAVEVLVRSAKLLESRDVGAAERYVRDSASWVYVDHLAEKVVGALAVRFLDVGAVLDAWVGDPYMWIRRTAVLALLYGIRRDAPDLERISRFGDVLIGEGEFFIRKALGWVLRELSKTDPDWVAGWVAARIGAISGVTMREAVRRLPPEDAERLLTAYRSR